MNFKDPKADDKTADHGVEGREGTQERSGREKSNKYRNKCQVRISKKETDTA